jgi:putative hemolysin
MADAIQPLPGRAALDHLSALLRLKVEAGGLDRLPTSGKVVVICNHPTGIADGIAVFDALKAARPDICFYANADAHRVSPGFSEVLIPVEWVEAKRTREKTRATLTLTREAMEAGRCLVIFPAGRLARRQPDGSLSDPEWMTSAISIARKHEAPVLPLHVAGPWSALFHFFHGVSTELRDITLFHELLNKQSREFRLTAGPLIAPEALDGDPAQVTARLKAYVEQTLPAAPDRAFA